MESFIIGIAGGTGSGQTTLTKRLKERFGDDVSVISHDNYYKRHDELPYEERCRLNYDHPDAFDTDLMVEQVQALRRGETIACPVYDFTVHNRSEDTLLIAPTSVIILEGILIFADSKLRDLMDVKIFVDTDADVRILRRVVRDVKKRGRTLESVVQQYLTTVKPMHEQFVEPSKRCADIIVPEVEAIATDVLAGTAAAGAQVVPSAEIAAICMDRERLRVLAHEELGLPTTPYRFAGSLEELRAGASEVGYPCVVKPVMSSSGHGQSVVRSADAIDAAWTEAQEGRRAADEGDVSRVIVEALAPLERELTVLTVSSSAGIVTCAPIGQRQESGDYRESWQPATEPDGEAERARDIARTAVEGLVAKAQAAGETGWGVFGVELFVLTDGSILFNEVSPRPHDTGMVTMASQRLSEFALHARAILGLPITPEHVSLTIPAGSVAASHAIVVAGDGEVEFTDVAAALAEPGTDLRIFAKPEVHGHRRMAVALAVGESEADARAKAGLVADALTITVE